MNSWGINFTPIYMYLYLSVGIARQKLSASAAVYLAPGVLMALFHMISEVMRSGVIVVDSMGYLIRFPPAVIWTKLGSSFCTL